jgi:hypothetical protein
MKFPICLLLLVFALPALADYDGSPAERAKWIEFCIGSLKDTGESEHARRVYCRCMSDVVDTADFRRLYEWERMFPPAHLGCFKKARFKPGGR